MVSFKRVNYRCEGQHCLLLLTPALLASMLPKFGHARMMSYQDYERAIIRQETVMPIPTSRGSTSIHYTLVREHKQTLSMKVWKESVHLFKIYQTRRLKWSCKCQHQKDPHQNKCPHFPLVGEHKSFADPNSSRLFLKCTIQNCSI